MLNTFVDIFKLHMVFCNDILKISTNKKTINAFDQNTSF